MTNCPEDPFLFTREPLCCNFKREILNVGGFEQWWVAVQRTFEHASQSFQHHPCTMRSLFDPFTSNVSLNYSRLQTEKGNSQTNTSRLPNHIKLLQFLWWLIFLVTEDQQKTIFWTKDLQKGFYDQKNICMKYKNWSPLTLWPCFGPSL